MAATPPPVFVFDNPEKSGHKTSGDPLMPSWPFRMACVGPPGCGKRVALLNVLVRLDPWPDRIVVLHLDPDTIEYDALEPDEIFSPDDPPDFQSFDRELRTLLIVDEIDLAALGKQHASDVERLFGHGSTHRNVSIVLCYQSFHRIPPAVRRSTNHIILFKSSDSVERSQIALRVGIPKEELAELCQLLKTPHESLWISLEEPPESPRRVRLNLWSPVLRKVAE